MNIYKYTYIHKKRNTTIYTGWLGTIVAPFTYEFLPQLFFDENFQTPSPSIESYTILRVSISAKVLSVYKERAHLNRPKEFLDEEPLDNSGLPCVQTCIHIHYNVDYLILTNVTL